MSNRQILEYALKCFAEPNKRQDYFRLYSDDIALHGYQGVKPGLGNVKQFYYAFWKIFPDAKVTLQELVEEEDTLVACYVITGTQHESFMGVTADGQRIELLGISILHSGTVAALNDGRVPIPWSC
jgi:predicted ester cyclase